MYFIINNTEDGIRVRDFATRELAQDFIDEVTSDDYMPQYQGQFQEGLPDERTADIYYCIIQGDIILPTKKYAL